MRQAVPYAIAFLAALSVGHAQEKAEAPPAGGKLVVGDVHRVACDAEGKVSYHCYVPKGYDAKKRYPVVFGFSPGDAGGEKPAERPGQCRDGG